MDKIDYIIVGLGIAGISICEQLRKNNKSFVVIDAKSSATSVAGGVVNPCVLKRFNPVWNSDSFFEYAFPFYKNLEAFISQEIVLETRVLKIFASNEDQNNWIVASDKKELEKYLKDELYPNRIAKKMDVSTSTIINYLQLRVGMGRIFLSDIIFRFQNYYFCTPSN